MQKKIRVAQFGLGPIGIESLKLAASKSWIEIVGGVDIAPDKIGKDLADITGDPAVRGKRVYQSIDELVAFAKPDMVLHTSVSKFAARAARGEPKLVGTWAGSAGRIRRQHGPHPVLPTEWG